MISLTDEQKSAVEVQQHLLLSACPGSGKTRVILAKLLALADAVAQSPRFVGCITYTNSAVDEIESRLRKYGNNTSSEKCDVSTIHSFCLQNILRPYGWLIEEVPRGFKVLTREIADFEQIILAVEDHFGRATMARTFDDYESLRADADGEPAGDGIETGIVTRDSAFLYWQIVRQRGFLDFAMILFYSLRILREYRFVGLGIAARFEWLLIDEFQDTTDVQLEIIRELHDHLSTTLFMVGDHNQSIMSFAGARPDLSREFAVEIGAELDYSLSANFRSAPEIIATAHTLIATNPQMHSEGEAKTCTAQVSYVHVGQAVEAITEHFLPMLQDERIDLGNAAILAPWWTHLLPVARALRGFDIPVFGPGARPYRRRRLLAGVAEQLGACAEAEHLLGLPGVEKALFRLIGDISGTTRFDVFSYSGRRTALSLIYRARACAAVHSGGVAWLFQVAEEISQQLHTDGWLPMPPTDLLVESAHQMVRDMRASRVDLENLAISDMGLFANPEKALKLITMHHSKGREFDAVAMISMNHGHLPHFSTRTQEQYDEARRLFYVGVTRAKRVLLVASDYSDRRNRPCPFIAEAGLELAESGDW
ncbi:AAA family ATPase [Sinorhizobium medicae]|nr:AAA family ATPase [Sinorhizobium medicae]